MPEPDPAWFEVREHTADLGLWVTADDRETLFLRAAVALLHLMAVTSGEPVRQYEVNIEAPDRGLLLVDWLNEVLYLVEGERAVPIAVSGLAVSDTKVCGVLTAGPVRSEGHGIGVKAVTYHRANVTCTSNGLVGEVILDI